MIEISDISKTLGEFELECINLTINEGEYFCILGPTGSGKTILLETIAGIYKPDIGSILFNNYDITLLPPRDRHISMVYQDFMLFPNMNVRENIGFGLKYTETKYDKSRFNKEVEQTAQMLDIVHLLDRNPSTLSGGEKQRVAIARAIITEPELLLLDEPLSALDSGTKDKLRRELKRIHQLKKTTTIHVTHSFEEVFSLADRVAIMHEGRIHQVGTPDEVFSRPQSVFVADFVGVENLFQGKSKIWDNLSEITVDGHTIISATRREGDVVVSIRPEDILISGKPIDSSARNSFRGVVSDVIMMKSTIKLLIDTGLTFSVMLTKRAYDEMELSPGAEVFLTFKASAVHLIH